MGRKTITLDNGELEPELQKRIDDYKKEYRARAAVLGRSLNAAEREALHKDMGVENSRREENGD